MSVDDVLNDFALAFAPDEVEKEKAAANKARILSRLASDLGTTELVGSGSYGRSTSVRGYSDIDYFALTPNGRLKSDSKASLADFRTALLKSFPSSEVTVRDPAVAVRFTSPGLSQHEIIPAYYIESYRGFRIFGMPNRSGGWMRSSPTGHAQWVDRENTRVGSNLKRLIRLIKVWNYLNEVGIRSFYLEMRTTERMASESTIVPSIDFVSTLRHLSGKQLADMNDPLGLNSRIEPCSPSALSGALTKINSAITLLERARELENSVGEAEAYRKWDEVFKWKLPRFR